MMIHRLLIGCASVALLAGCQSSLMKQAPNQTVKPKPGMAKIIFMRSSMVGAVDQASVFDVSTSKNILVGIVSDNTRVAYSLKPGKHLFMVVGENADFMGGDLAPNHTYYAFVAPRPGFWKQRFSLVPFHTSTLAKYQVNSKFFKDIFNDTHFVTPSISAYAWARNNAESIEGKRKSYIGEWKKMLPADRAAKMLRPEDGVLYYKTAEHPTPATPHVRVIHRVKPKPKKVAS